jgi:hypothetical protein
VLTIDDSDVFFEAAGPHPRGLSAARFARSLLSHDSLLAVPFRLDLILSLRSASSTRIGYRGWLYLMTKNTVAMA